MNENRIRIYDTSSAEVTIANELLEKAEAITFSTVYPGGIFDQCSFFVPCDITRTFPIKHGHRVVIRNGLKVVWEGFVANLVLSSGESISGVSVEALGYIALVNKHYLYHRYIDRRTQSGVSGVWMTSQTWGGADKCTYDQNNRLYFVPKAVSWTASEGAAFQYLSNGMGWISRVDFNYYLSGCGNNWGMRLIDAYSGSLLWSTSTNTAASGTCSVSFAASNQTAGLWFVFRNASTVAITPQSDGSVYGKVTNLAVYGVDDSNNYQTIVSDIIKSLALYLCRYSASLFSSDPSLITTNSYDMTTAGFVCDDLNETFLQMMNRVGTFSASNVAYSVGVKEAEAIAGGTRPLIYYEQQPAVTDYEYAVRIDEKNLAGIELVISADPQELYNRLWVQGVDTAGKDQWVNHVDDARLTDETSRTNYLSRMEIVRTNQVFNSLTAMADYGVRFINSNKNLKFYMRQPLTLNGTIRRKDGNAVPVSQIRAGERIKIENWLTDVGSISNTGLTFLISRTEYDDITQTNRVSCGTPDDLAVYLARQQLMNNRYL